LLLLSLCRQQLLEQLGHDWQGLAGVAGEVPSEAQLARVVAGAKGLLLLLGPGRLLARLPPQVKLHTVAASCTCAFGVCCSWRVSKAAAL
jgi:hypothetical protein